MANSPLGFPTNVIFLFIRYLLVSRLTLMYTIQNDSELVITGKYPYSHTNMSTRDLDQVRSSDCDFREKNSLSELRRTFPKISDNQNE